MIIGMIAKNTATPIQASITSGSPYTVQSKESVGFLMYIRPSPPFETMM